MVTRAEAAPWSPASDCYFECYADGVYDTFNHLHLILPADRAYVVAERGDLVVGHAGVDGIEFCFRRGIPGVFAWYGIEAEHRLVAEDLDALLRCWNDRTIKL
ncbi:hypothetical protein ACW9UR_13515 [Halovulum sp. GXIMD14794]